MKAVFLNDEEVTLSDLADEHKNMIEPRVRLSRGIPQSFWVFPKGCVVEGVVALHIAKSGQGSPLDEECAKACGLNAVQLRALQVNYEMDAKGIHSANDRELYRAGVILGYDENLKYIPGPNMEKYQAELVKTKKGKGQDE